MTKWQRRVRFLIAVFAVTFAVVVVLAFKHRATGTAPISVARTDPNHIKGTIPEQDPYRSRTLLKSFEAAPDGNEVVLEEQMQKVGDTRADYNTAVQLMQSNLKMLRMALGRGGTSA